MKQKKEQFTVTVKEVVEKTKEILKSKLVDGNNFAWLTIMDETIENALDNLSVSKRDKDNLQGIYRESITNAAYFTDIAENIYYQQEDDIFFICYKETKNGGAAIEFQALKCKDIDTKVKVREEEKETYDLLKEVGINVVLLRKVGESKQIIMGYEVMCDDYVECDEYDNVYHSPKEECIEDAVKVEETPKADAVKEKKTKKVEEEVKIEETPKAEVTETPKVEEKKVESKKDDNITEFIVNAVFGFISVVCVTVIGALFGIFSFIGKSI